MSKEFADVMEENGFSRLKSAGDASNQVVCECFFGEDVVYSHVIAYKKIVDNDKHSGHIVLNYDDDKFCYHFNDKGMVSNVALLNGNNEIEFVTFARMKQVADNSTGVLCFNCTYFLERWLHNINEAFKRDRKRFPF